MLTLLLLSSISVVKAYWLGISVAGSLIWVWIVWSIWQKEKGWTALFFTLYITMVYGIVLWLFPLGIVDLDPAWAFVLALLTLIVVLWWNSITGTK